MENARFADRIREATTQGIEFARGQRDLVMSTVTPATTWLFISDPLDIDDRFDRGEED